jgi:transposase
MKEDFQQFREYSNPGWAGKSLDQWCMRAMRSQIDPMKKAAYSGTSSGTRTTGLLAES